MNILSPQPATQLIKELFLEVLKKEERQSWIDALTEHTQYIESIASFTKQYPDPVLSLTGFLMLYNPNENNNNTESEGFERRRTPSDSSTLSDASTATYTTIASVTNPTATLGSDSAPPTAPSSSSGRPTMPPRGSTFGNSGGRGAPARPSLVHQPSLRHALLVTSSETIANVNLKVPQMVQQLCQPGEKILMYGMVSTLNRAYVYVIRLLVFLKPTITVPIATLSADKQEGNDAPEEEAPCVKRILCLDSNSYSIKQEIRWQYVSNSQLPTVRQVIPIPFLYSSHFHY